MVVSSRNDCILFYFDEKCCILNLNFSKHENVLIDLNFCYDLCVCYKKKQAQCLLDKFFRFMDWQGRTILRISDFENIYIFLIAYLFLLCNLIPPIIFVVVQVHFNVTLW